MGERVADLEKYTVSSRASKTKGRWLALCM